MDSTIRRVHEKFGIFGVCRSKEKNAHGDKDLRHVVQNVQHGVPIGVIIRSEGEHDQHIVAEREAQAADEEQKQRPARGLQRAAERTGATKSTSPM